MSSYRSQRPGQLYKMLARGDVERVKKWFDDYMDKAIEIPNRVELAVRLAIIADWDIDLERLIDVLMQDPEKRILAVGLYVRQRVIAGMPLSEAIGELPGQFSVHYGDQILAAFTEFPPDRALKPGRHLAIAGVSYCGSTLMERMLGGLENVVSVGQSIDLINRTKKDKGGERLENFQELDFSKSDKCAQCGVDCEYLTPNFRAALTLNPINWYQQLGDRFSEEVLVSADKNLPKIIRHDPLMRFDALVMFKSPIQAWFSEIQHVTRKQGSRPASMPLEERMHRYVEDWRGIYETCLNGFSPQGTVAFLDFGEFTRNPESTLRRALEKVNIELDPGVLKQIRPSHSIGGNGPVVRNLRDDSLTVNIKPRDDSVVPKDQRDWIMAQTEAMDVFAGLQEAAAA